MRKLLYQLGRSNVNHFHSAMRHLCEQRAITSPPLGPMAEMNEWRYIRIELRSIVAPALKIEIAEQSF